MSKNLKNLRKKLETGKLVKGFFLTMGDAAVSEIAGLAGYDYGCTAGYRKRCTVGCIWTGCENIGSGS